MRRLPHRLLPPALVAGVVVLAFVAFWAARRERPAGDPSAPSERVASLGDAEAFLWSRVGTRLLVVRRADRASHARWVTNYTAGSTSPAPAGTAAERAALVAEFGAVYPDRVRRHVSPDGKQVAVGMPESVSLADADPPEATRVLIRGGMRPAPGVSERWIFAPCWSPDGRRIACVVVEARSRLPMGRWAQSPVGIRVARWARRSARVGLWVVDVSDGRTRRALDLGPFDPEHGIAGARAWLQWSPDGRRLGFIHEGDVWAVPVGE